MQNVERQDRRLGKLEPRVSALEESDKIDRAVAAVRGQLRNEMFTTTQKIGAALVGAVAVADFVRGMVIG